jgi:hypothetical protein
MGQLCGTQHKLLAGDFLTGLPISVRGVVYGPFFWGAVLVIVDESARSEAQYLLSTARTLKHLQIGLIQIPFIGRSNAVTSNIEHSVFLKPERSLILLAAEINKHAQSTTIEFR